MQETPVQEAWDGFVGGNWQRAVDVRDFIQKNYTPYDGDDSFLAGPTEATTKLWADVMDLFAQETANGGVLDMDTKLVSTITSHEAGYIEKPLEQIVGLQTDKPLKRALMVDGGIRMAMAACKAYGYEVDPEIVDFYTYRRKTHNAGVFDVYTEEMRKCRHSHIITGLPDAYGRGRIIGDYRRVALYGVDALITDKTNQKNGTGTIMDEKTIRHREELSEQIRALKELKQLGEIYGFDLSRPAENFKEAVQWLYLGYLAAVKEQNGAAMSIGRNTTFLDIYAERDLARGTFTESEIQEIVDHLVMKLRMVKFARTPEYNELFSGDPQWVTESIGGVGIDGRSMVTKSSFRWLHTLENMGTSPEPNLTVLWSTKLPVGFKRYCAKISITTSSIQYENDDLMRVYHGDDYAIACCVSSMRVGKEMQFFGARANLAKCLLYAINGGRDEKTGEQIGPKYRAVEGEYLDYDDVFSKYLDMMRWLAGVYVNALNAIHYMHDKYSYERIQMALHDEHVHRWFATGIAGLSVVADSLSAIKYAKVRVVRDETGLVTDYVTEGDFPKYGNDDDRVDTIAHDIVEIFMNMIRQNHTYRDSVPTTSILTITSNVVYGKFTGNMPDGRPAGAPLAPGANPSYGAEQNGLLASLNSTAKLPYEYALDGISNTQTISPDALGHNDEERISTLVGVMDGYFDRGAHHLNVNVFGVDKLIDCMEHPEKEEYANFTIRVSGYAVKFIDLTREQQMDVIARRAHGSM